MLSSHVNITDFATDQAFATGHAKCSVCSKWVRVSAISISHVCKRCSEAEEQKYAELPPTWSPLRLF